MTRNNSQVFLSPTDPRLRLALDGYLRPLPDLYRDGESRLSWRQATSANDGLDGAVAELWSLLAPSTLYEGPWEVPQRIHEIFSRDHPLGPFSLKRLARCLEEERRGNARLYAEFVEALAEELCSAGKAIPFKTPLSYRGIGDWPDMTLGGEVDLAVSVEDEDDMDAPGTKCLVLSGRLSATTELSMVRRVGEVVQQILGVGIALGFFRLNDPLPGSDTSRMWIETGWDMPLRPAPEVERAVQSCIGLKPDSGSDIDAMKARRGESTAGLVRMLEIAKRLFDSGAGRATELRHVASLLLRAAVERDRGPRVSAGFVCLEAALMDPREDGSISSKLREAISFRLGRTLEARADLRELVGRLYRLRCHYVHTGRCPIDRRLRDPENQILLMAAEIVRGEISAWVQLVESQGSPTSGDGMPAPRP